MLSEQLPPDPVVAVDITVEIVISRPRGTVAAFVSDLDNVTAWSESFESIKWQADGPLAAGTRLGGVARLLGRRFPCVLEVAELEPGRRLVIRTDGEPVQIEVTYEWEDAAPAQTRMLLRTRALPVTWACADQSRMDRALWRANRKSLERLRRILERAA